MAKILIACEFSGIVRESFRARGHDAWSCDLLPSEIPGPHIQDDVLNYIKPEYQWDLMIAHPPCTRLANSGVRWLQERNLWQEMEESAIFFKTLLNATIPRIVIENPVPHKYALIIIGRKYNQIINPWQFGHEESKKTCLWIKNLPLLQPTQIMNVRNKNLTQSGQNKLGPSSIRWKERSRTYTGIAEALASQYSDYLLTPCT